MIDIADHSSSLEEILEDQNLGDKFIATTETLLRNQNIQNEELNEIGYEILELIINEQIELLEDLDEDQLASFNENNGFSEYSVEKIYDMLSLLIKGGTEEQRKKVPDLLETFSLKSTHRSENGDTALIETETFEMSLESFSSLEIYNKTMWSFSSALTMPALLLLPEESTSIYSLIMIHWIDSPFLIDIPNGTNSLVNMTSISVMDSSTYQHVNMTEFEQPANLTFYIQEENMESLDQNLQCVYYDKLTNQFLTDGLSIPDEDGVIQYEGRTSLVTCNIEHFTDFTLFFTYKEVIIPEKERTTGNKKGNFKVI